MFQLFANNHFFPEFQWNDREKKWAREKDWVLEIWNAGQIALVVACPFPSQYICAMFRPKWDQCKVLKKKKIFIQCKTIWNVTQQQRQRQTVAVTTHFDLTLFGVVPMIWSKSLESLDTIFYFSLFVRLFIGDFFPQSIFFVVFISFRIAYNEIITEHWSKP